MRGGEGIRILRHQKNERDPQTGSDKDILNILKKWFSNIFPSGPFIDYR